MGKTTCKVILEHKSVTATPLKVKNGEELTITEKESEWPGWIWCVNGSGVGGWVPQDYLEGNEGCCQIQKDYDATELTIQVGERLIVKLEVSGWLWCTNEKGKSGWVPKTNVVVHGEELLD